MLFIRAIAICWGIFFLFWLVTAFGAKRTVEHANLNDQLLYMVFLLLGFFMLLRGYSHSIYPLNVGVLPHTQAIWAIGLALTVVGLVLALWARATLGRNWSGQVVFKENHQLVQNGPYAFVRHPIYTAMSLMFLGTTLAFGNLGGFIGIVLVLYSFWLKYRQEEVLMQEHFPEYLSYKARVKALIPFLF